MTLDLESPGVTRQISRIVAALETHPHIFDDRPIYVPEHLDCVAEQICGNPDLIEDRCWLALAGKQPETRLTLMILWMARGMIDETQGETMAIYCGLDPKFDACPDHGWHNADLVGRCMMCGLPLPNIDPPSDCEHA
jgi:hypothetical protein